MDVFFAIIFGAIIAAIFCTACLYPHYSMNLSGEKLRAFFSQHGIIDYESGVKYGNDLLKAATKVRRNFILMTIVVILIGIVWKGAFIAGYLGAMFLGHLIADAKARKSINALVKTFTYFAKDKEFNWDVLEEEYQYHKWHPLTGNQIFASFCDWYGHSEARRVLRRKNATRAEEKETVG